MKTIYRLFRTIRQAERFQKRLYDKYNYVRLAQSPRWGEAGQYVWEVKG